MYHQKAVYQADQNYDIHILDAAVSHLRNMKLGFQRKPVRTKQSGLKGISPQSMPYYHFSGRMQTTYLWNHPDDVSAFHRPDP